MAYIVRTFIYRYFKNYLCTITGFFFIGLYVFALIVPFLFALSTGGNLYNFKKSFGNKLKCQQINQRFHLMGIILFNVILDSEMKHHQILFL